MVAQRASGGFTLTELMVAVAIAALLTSLAAPSFQQFISNQRMKGVSSDLLTALARARSEAIKRNTEVTMAPVTAGSWQYGWSIPNPSDAGHKLDDHAAIANAIVTGPASVVYLATGRIKGASAPAFDISFVGADPHRCVRVDLSGRPYQKTTAC